MFIWTILKAIYYSLFGKHDDRIWKEFAEKNGAEYCDDDPFKVNLLYKGHLIQFDTYTHLVSAGSATRESTFVRVQAAVETRQDLQFRLISESLLDKVAILFGAGDIRIGHNRFDKKVRLTSNDEATAVMLFSDEKLIDLIIAHNDIHLALYTDKGVFDEVILDGNALLYFISEDKIRSTDQLKNLLSICMMLIDQLQRLAVLK